jgi:hypothetical protein
MTRLIVVIVYTISIAKFRRSMQEPKYQCIEFLYQSGCKGVRDYNTVPYIEKNLNDNIVAGLNFEYKYYVFSLNA